MTDPLPRPFQPIEALAVMNRHGVRFVLVGGFAARLLGSSLITQDLDICYARDDANLAALSAALTEIHATLRGVHELVPSKLDPRTLKKGDAFMFVTDLADFDILGTPSGTTGYDELAATATEYDLDGVRVKVASIDALIRMKVAAGRAKDRAALPILEALKDEIENPPRDRR